MAEHEIIASVVFVGVMVVVLAFALGANRGSYVHYNWRTVSVREIGIFRVPKKWIVTQESGIVYITDKPLTSPDYKTYLIGTIRDKSGKAHDIPTYKLFEDVEYGRLISSTISPNGASRGQSEYMIDGHIKAKYFFGMTSTSLISRIEFLAWDDLIDEDTLTKIANSYRRYYCD